MKIAVVTAESGGFFTAVDHAFAVQSVIQLLSRHHDVRHFPFTRDPNPHMMSGLRHHDAVLIFAPDILNRKEGEIPLTPDLLASLRIPVIPFGLSSHYVAITSESNREWRDRWLKLWHQSSGTLGVEDSNIQNDINSLLGKGAAKVIGSWGLYLQADPLLKRESRTLFCPWVARKPALLSSESYRRLLGGLFEELNSIHPTLLLAQHSKELMSGAAAGLSTLYCPKFPMLHAKAIASATGIVTSRIQPAVVAVSMGVPALILSMDETSSALARGLGIPFIELQESTNPAEVAEQYSETLAKYPWADVNAKIQAQRKSVQSFLKEKGFGDLGTNATRGKVVRLPTRKASDPMLSFASCVDSKSLPSLFALVENLRNVENRALDIHLLLFDKTIEAEVRARLNGISVKFYDIEECLPLEERAKLDRLTRTEQMAKCRPSFLMKILEHLENPLFYFDVDLHFFRTPMELIDKLKNHNVMLFPNWNRTLNFNRRYGLFNADMMLVRPEGRAVLEWWNRLVVHRCSGDADESYFLDQGYLDLLSLYFGNEVMAYRELDHGIATWNLETLGIYFRNTSGSPYLNGGRPIGSIQVEGVDPIGAFDLKTAYDQIVTFFNASVRQGAVGELNLKCLTQQSKFRVEIHRLLAAYNRVPRVFRNPNHLLSKSRMEFFTKGFGATMLNLASVFNRATQLVTGRKPKYYWDESTDFWIPLQKEILFPRHLPERAPAPPKKRASAR